VQLLYDIPAFQVEFVRHEEPVLTPPSGRGGTHSQHLVMESFIDELAAAGAADPVEYRRALSDKAPRARAVLDLAAKAAGWENRYPPGRGLGVTSQSSATHNGGGRRGHARGVAVFPAGCFRARSSTARARGAWSRAHGDTRRISLRRRGRAHR